MPQRTLIFFYPSKVVGGAEFLFARLALYFTEQLKYTVYYIDYEDGFVRQNPSFASLHFLKYSDKQKFSLVQGGTLISPISNLFRLSQYIDFQNPQTKLFFWCLHPYNIVNEMPQAFCFQLYTPRQIAFLLQHIFKNTYETFSTILSQLNRWRSLAFMDIDNYQFNRTIFGDIISENYLPIISPHKKCFSDGKLINTKQINIAILGRLCEEKVPPLCNVLYQLEHYHSSFSKKVYIIGEGSSKPDIHPEQYPSLEITFAGSIMGEDLNSYLLTHADVVFAMGTSLLEAAGLHIPAVSIPVSFKPFMYDKALFLYQHKGYSLGSTLSVYKEQACITIAQILDGVYKHNYKSIWGEKCANYVKEKHNIAHISSRLVDYLSHNGCYAKKYCKIIDKLGPLKTERKFLARLLKQGAKYARF